MSMRFYHKSQDWLHWNIILGLLCVTLIVGTIAVFTTFPRPQQQATILWLFNNIYHVVALFAINQSSLDYEDGNLLMTKLALNATQLTGGTLSGLVVWDGQPGDGPGGTASMATYWPSLGLSLKVISTVGC